MEGILKRRFGLLLFYCGLFNAQVTYDCFSEPVTQLQKTRNMVALLTSQGSRYPHPRQALVRKEPVRRKACASGPRAPLTARRWPRRHAAAVVGAPSVMLLTIARRQTRMPCTHVVASHSTSLAPYLASTLAHSSSIVQRLPPTLTPLTLVGGPPTTLATRSSTLARFSGACVV